MHLLKFAQVTVLQMVKAYKYAKKRPFGPSSRFANFNLTNLI